MGGATGENDYGNVATTPVPGSQNFFMSLPVKHNSTKTDIAQHTHSDSHKQTNTIHGHSVTGHSVTGQSVTNTTTLKKRG